MGQSGAAWPVLHSPEDADATHRWARACLEMWEAERAELLERIVELESALREVGQSGVEFDDERLGYVSVQIDRDVWEAVRNV